MSAKKPGHFGRRLQIALGIGAQFKTGLGNWPVQTDRGEHILERTATGDVIKHIIDRHQGEAGNSCHAGRLFESKMVVPGIGR